MKTETHGKLGLIHHHNTDVIIIAANYHLYLICHPLIPHPQHKFPGAAAIISLFLFIVTDFFCLSLFKLLDYVNRSLHLQGLNTEIE